MTGRPCFFDSDLYLVEEKVQNTLVCKSFVICALYIPFTRDKIIHVKNLMKFKK